jgi:hypothetical protein
MNIKRLAAVDMYGGSGSMLRRRLVLVEFIIAVIGGIALGTWTLAAVAGVGGIVFGVWLLGTGLNYVPLAAYAIALSRPGALDAELADVDVNRELRFYTVRLFWLFVPLAIVAMAARRN